MMQQLDDHRKPIRVMTVENHPIFRSGLEALISSQPDMELVAQAEAADEALSEYRRLRPDVVLMNQRLPGTTGDEPSSSSASTGVVLNEMPMAATSASEPCVFMGSLLSSRVIHLRERLNGLHAH